MTGAKDTAEVERILDEHDEVARDMEFGHIHDPDSDHGDDHPTVRADYLDAEECWACRQCWGYPGTEAELDAILAEKDVDVFDDGQQDLERWAA